MTERDISTKVCTLCKRAKAFEFFTNDKNRADGKHPHCKVCTKARMAHRYQANKELYAAAGKLNYEKNKDAYKKRAKNWAKENPEKRKEVAKRYVRANPDKRYLLGVQSRVNNPGMYRAHFKKRQQLKRNAMPAWADEEAIKAIYEECSRISKETGVLHHVDHYYPLKNDRVCGLHNEYNLQILTAFDNLSKGNSFPTE